MLSILCACEEDSKRDAGQQIIAKVNGDGITVRDLTDQLARIETRVGMDTKIGKKRVLESLVDEKLLVQRAIDVGLDRKPETIAALDRARRQVLAQASIDHAMQSARADARETKAFYDAHPDWFERRKTYIFRRFELLNAELQPSLKEEIDRAGSPAQVGLILKRAKVDFSDKTEIREAEMLPPDVLAQAARMQRGDILISSEGGRIIFMQLVSSIAEPVDLDRAAPAIRAYLAEGRRKNTAKNLLRDLRNDARIEFSDGLIGSAVRANAGPSDAARGTAFRTDVARAATVNRPK